MENLNRIPLSLTIWTGASDQVDRNALGRFIEIVGKDRQPDLTALLSSQSLIFASQGVPGRAMEHWEGKQQCRCKRIDDHNGPLPIHIHHTVDAQFVINCYLNTKNKLYAMEGH